MRSLALALLLLGCEQPPPLSCRTLEIDVATESCTATFTSCSDDAHREVACVPDADQLLCTCATDGVADVQFFSETYCDVLLTAEEPAVRDATVDGCAWDLHDPQNPTATP